MYQKPQSPLKPPLLLYPQGCLSPSMITFMAHVISLLETTLMFLYQNLEEVPDVSSHVRYFMLNIKGRVTFLNQSKMRQISSIIFKSGMMYDYAGLLFTIVRFPNKGDIKYLVIYIHMWSYWFR